MKDTGLTQSQADLCIYYNIEDNKMIIVAVYVDDLLLLSNDRMLTNKMKKSLMDSFNMKELGETHYILGMQIKRDHTKGKLWIDQEAYIKDIFGFKWLIVIMFHLH